MDLAAGGQRLFDIRGDGLLTVGASGIQVQAGGMSVTGTLTVGAGASARRVSFAALGTACAGPVSKVVIMLGWRLCRGAG